MTADNPGPLAHLPIDAHWKLRRPYTTGDMPLGREDNDIRLRCAMERLCTMCGKPVADLAAVLCGLGELHNRVLRDGPMRA